MTQDASSDASKIYWHKDLIKDSFAPTWIPFSAKFQTLFHAISRQYPCWFILIYFSSGLVALGIFTTAQINFNCCRLNSILYENTVFSFHLSWCGTVHNVKNLYHINKSAAINLKLSESHSIFSRLFLLSKIKNPSIPDKFSCGTLHHWMLSKESTSCSSEYILSLRLAIHSFSDSALHSLTTV